MNTPINPNPHSIIGLNYPNTYDQEWYQGVDPMVAVEEVADDMRVFVQGGHCTSEALLDALCDRAWTLRNVEIVHMHSHTRAPHLAPEMAGHLRHNAFFVGPSAREAVNAGRADYTPAFLSDIPALLTNGLMPIDVALVQVSPPDAHGFCTLGPSVDIARAAVDTARVVIAEVNSQVPRTHGNSQVHLKRFKHLIWTDHPLPMAPPPKVGPEAAEIGRLVATLVEDGATLQFGIGEIPSAALAALTGKHDLGIHSELISDAVVDLFECGAITNQFKHLDKGAIVSSFAVGSERLMRFIDDNPLVQFRPTDYTNDPHLIRKQPKMVSINSAIEIDLSGQVCAESIGPMLYSGVGGQVDFLRGSALSKGGKPIIALPSTAKRGTVSRISPILSEAAAVTTTRSHVHYVVTEHGIAYLHGLSLRERAEALINIAHPDFRAELRRSARTGPSIVMPALANGNGLTKKSGDEASHARPEEPVIR